MNVPDFDTLVPAPELSLPIQCVVIISKGLIFCIHELQLWSGHENVEIRYVSGMQLCSGDVGFVTWRSSSYRYALLTYRLMHIEKM